MKSAIFVSLLAVAAVTGCGKKDQECAQIKPIIADRLAKIEAVQKLSYNPADLAAITDTVKAYADGASAAKKSLEEMKVSTLSLKRPVFDYNGIAFEAATMLSMTASDFAALLRKKADAADVSDKFNNSKKYIQEYSAKEKTAAETLAAACGG